MTQSIRLTDDEIAATEIGVGGRWSTVLPTVDRTSQDEHARAAARGIRSFVVRQFVAADEPGELPSSEVRELVKPAIGSVPTLVAWQAEPHDPYRPTGLTLSLFSGLTNTDERLLVVSTSNGIHDLSVATRGDSVRVAQNFIAVTSEVGTVTVVRPSSQESGHYATISQGESSTGTYIRGVYTQVLGPGFGPLDEL